MKILKNAALCLFMATSVLGVSTAFASENTDIIDAVIVKIHAAETAMTDEKSTTADITTIISEAKSKSKGISASDSIASKVQGAAKHLTKALTALKYDDKKAVTDHLKDGVEAFEALKTVKGIS
jgi:hypothetical protein